MRLTNDVSMTEQTNKHEIIVFTAQGKLFPTKPKPGCLLSSAQDSLPLCTFQCDVSDTVHCLAPESPTVCTSDTVQFSTQHR